MKQTLDVINAMEAEGIIGRYAIAGAVAAYNYIEPALTDDLDIFVTSCELANGQVPAPTWLEPICSYLKSKGYHEPRKEGIVIEGWPVQFVPATNPLNAEALAQAEDIEIETTRAEAPIKARVLHPEYIIANALRIGRPQDLVLIVQFLQAGAVDMPTLSALLDVHALKGAWLLFCRRTGIGEPCNSREFKKDKQKTGFPDISDILARKAEGRREIARRSFGEKIAMMEALRERLEPFKRAREARQAKRDKPTE